MEVSLWINFVQVKVNFNKGIVKNFYSHTGKEFRVLGGAGGLVLTLAITIEQAIFQLYLKRCATIESLWL
jgi:hypothetical protein